MNFKIIAFLLKKYLLEITKKTHNSFIFKMTLLTITVAVFVLHLSYSIMQSFNNNVTNTMEKLYPTLLVSIPAMSENDFRALKKAILSQFSEVKSIYSSACKEILLQNSFDAIIMPTTCIGIDPEFGFILTNNLDEQILIKEKLLHNQCIIGQKLANKVGLECNDSCTIFSQKKAKSLFKKINYQKKLSSIGHVLSADNSFYHQNSIYCSLNTFKNFFKTDSINTLHILLRTTKENKAITLFLRQNIDCQIDTWKTLHPEITELLFLQSSIFYSVALLLSLMTLIIITALISAEIGKRKIEIAGLLLLGLDLKTIKFTFILLTTIITCFTTILGIILSYLSGQIINYYELFTLPEGNFIRKIEYYFVIENVSFFLIGTFLLACFASLYAAKTVQTNKVSELLRFEE